MRTAARSGTSARLTATAAGRARRLQLGWPRPSIVGIVAGTLFLCAGCGQAAPPASLANCPDGTCVTGTAPATIAAVTGSPPAESVRRTTTPVNGAAGEPTAPTAPATPSPAATPVAFASDTAAFGPVIWATAIEPDTRAPLEPATVISTSAATIYAAVAVHHLTAGTTVTAQWSYNRTRLESFDQILVASGTVTDTWIEFHLALSQPGAWPEGTYEVNVFVNDQPALSSSVEVRDPGT